MYKISLKQRPCHCSFQFLAENMKISTFTHVIGESIFFLVFYLHPFILILLESPSSDDRGRDCALYGSPGSLESVFIKT